MSSPLAQEAQDLLGKKTTVVDTHQVTTEKVTVVPPGPKDPTA